MMGRSTGGVLPHSFHTVLIDAVPQFAERNSTGTGYAQQGLASTLSNRLKS
jgi:hypothetical protein